MLLQEEYIKRHSLDILPIVYTSSGSAIVKDGPHYLILHLEWVPQPWRVGHFKFSTCYPTHNAHLISTCYDCKDVEIAWDRYEFYFRNWSSVNNFKPVKNRLLACWEIFLYCFDGWLARNATPEFMKLVDKTADNYDLSIIKAIEYLRDNYSSQFSRFRSQILKHCTDNYMEWLMNLLESNIELSSQSR